MSVKKPFNEVTLYLQGQVISGSYGVIWEALPALEYLLRLIEAGMNALMPILKKVNPLPLAICYQNSWQVLSKYN